MKLLITGGCGFIGSNFIRYILNKYPDYKIINLDLLTYAGNLENLKDVIGKYSGSVIPDQDPGSSGLCLDSRFHGNDRYVFVRGDIADKNLVDGLIKDVDIVVNFAAESHVDRSILDSSAFIHTNIIGTHTLLESARKYNKRFHHVSTDEVFGALGPNDPAFDENTPYNPRSPYSASKAASDHLARAYFHTYNLSVTISNCSNNYGPFQFPEKLHGLFVTNLLEGKKVPVYGDGLQIRDWLFVEDHCEGIDVIVHKGKMGESYCLGGNAEKTNLEITKNILQLLNLGEEMMEYVTDRPGHDRRYAMNFSKAKNELGWSPKTSFEEGMKKTVEWYKNNEVWWRKIKSGEYMDYYKKQYGSS